jgi:murein DD-endopeptidase MepM/ murein hydrolase activator NlpD
MCAILPLLFGCGACAYVFTGSPIAHAASISSLQQQISAGRGRISSLAGAVSAASSQVGQLRSNVHALERQIARIQADLDAKRAELLKLRTQLTAARARLAQLEAFEAHAESVLSRQLVSAYESDRPDIISVVLESSGFQDLLERLAFAKRIRKQDVQVVSEVRAARRAVAAQATRLGALEAREQVITQQVLQQRNRLAQNRISLVQQELAAAELQRKRVGQLAAARARVADLNQQLSQAQAAQAAAAAAQAAQASPSTVAAAFVGAGAVSSGGGFTFPMPKGDASSPSTWSLDQGVDISAPGGTPELAVCSGTVVLHGIGGFGPWAPVLHCDSPVGGYSYVYYGHAGPANEVAVGTHVGAGSVISEVGPGIVGISTGPHLEIGFCDSSGSPIGGSSASTMLSLLQGAYGG